MRLRPLTARRRDDTGASLVDLLVSAVLVTVVLAVTGLAVISMTRTSARLEATARSSTLARAVVDTWARSLGQAAAVNEPGTVGSATYLEARTDAVRGGATAFCTQWRLRADVGDLAVRTWPVGSTTATAWTTVATGVSAPAGRQPILVGAVGGGWRSPRAGLDLRLQQPRGAVVPVEVNVAVVNAAEVSTVPVCPEVPRS